jgi:hypothetical protein
MTRTSRTVEDFDRVARVDAVPSCDLCAMRGVRRAAIGDAPTTSGPWANLCREHFRLHGVRGVGFRFVLRGES